LDAGTTTLAIVPPAGYETISNPANNRRAQLVATVNASSTIALCSFDGAPCTYGTSGTLRVGEDLQTVGYFQFEEASPSPVTVTITVADPSVALVSTSETAQGAGTITFENLSGMWAYFVVQGLAQGQATTLTVSAPGYAPLTYAVEVDPSGFVFFQPFGDFTTDAFAANTYLGIQSARLVRGTNAYASQQEVRGGLTVPVSVTSSNTGIGIISVTPLQMQAVADSVSNSAGYTEFDPQGPSGTSTLTVVTPAGWDTIGVPGDGSRRVLVATVTGGLPPGQVNLSLLPGTSAVGSSEYGPGYAAALAIDAVNSTSQSWCTANDDPAPRLTVTFPVDATVRSINVLTPWSPNYDFLTGIFRVLDASDTVIHDSGVVGFTNGGISYVVPLADQDPGARRVELIGVTWNSIEPCLGEIAIGGSVP
jgi:hypothetical protein